MSRLNIEPQPANAGETWEGLLQRFRLHTWQPGRLGALVLLAGHVNDGHWIPLWIQNPCRCAAACMCARLAETALNKLVRASGGIAVCASSWTPRGFAAPDMGPNSTPFAAARIDVADERVRTIVATLRELNVHSVVLSPENANFAAPLRSAGIEVHCTKDESVYGSPRFVASNSALCTTLSYAQSIDGSIALANGRAVRLSSDATMGLTHTLRASHDAILVGVETVIADNPRLTVRHALGRDPQSVILDSRLRLPLTCKLLSNERRPWIFCTPARSLSAHTALEAAGARVFVVAANREGRVDLSAVHHALRTHGIKSMLVEGGATVISSYLASDLVSQVIVTIAPRLLAGLCATRRGALVPLDLCDVEVERWGPDIVVRGRPRTSREASVTAVGIALEH